MGREVGKELLDQPQYQFLKENIHLGRHIILLGLSGSYAYGTNDEESDIDIRGVALNRKSELIGMTSFEQYEDQSTDTVIYSFQKIIRLLLECNPNTCELLGLNPEHYLYVSPIGKELLEHRSAFLSRRAIHSFAGYADQQLRRLQNALAGDSLNQIEREEQICRSLENAMDEFQSRYRVSDYGTIALYLDRAEAPGLEQEIFADVSIRHYPLRDYKNLWGGMNSIVKQYDKIGKRNHKKDNRHLNKHAMHLIRLFLMALDILERGEIRTCRKKEHELLMAIRNGYYQKEDGTYKVEFFELVKQYEEKLQQAAKTSRLPDEPDYQAVEAFMMNVNERIIRNEI